jgi:hypothetical protein
MSDPNETGPIPQEEMNQIEHGISQWMRQPVLAPRYLKNLLNRLNSALETIQDLEARVMKLESGKAPSPPKSNTPTTPTKPKTPDDI